jgi:TonB family protein
VQSNLNYPSEAIKKGVEGQVVVKFIVDVDGTVENIYSLNELGGDCEEEAIRIIENMNNLSEKWTPAKYNGKSIKMANELTIEFYQEREKNKTRGTSEEKGENFSLEAEDPIFPGCGYLENYSKKIGCSHVKLYSYVQSNLKYPEEAIKKGIQGVVNVEYFVNIDGSIKVINIINDIGGGCGKEAKRIIENMNNLPAKWTPAKLRGIPVRFRRTQSIEFKLEDELVVEEEPEYIEVKEDKNEEEIFKMAEQSPRFPGCEDMEGNNSEKLKCAQKRMLEYIYGNLIYPAEAREEVIEGQVVIQFIVERHIHKCPKMLFIS